MKFLIVFALVLATVSAFDYRRSVIEPRNVVVPIVEKEGRITNGNNAHIGQFPYQVWLLFQYDETTAFSCGGSIISRDYVMTAAHCVDGMASVRAYFGFTFIRKDEIIQNIPKENFRIHPQWNSANLANDIALIELVEKLVFSSIIQPVKLPPRSDSHLLYEGEYATASGWGRSSDYGNSSPNNLQYVPLEVISNDLCALTYGRYIKFTNICTDTPNGQSTCNGDSGGPLVLENSGFQIGITSFGSAAGCSKGAPAVFSRVSKFMDWIGNTAGLSL